jgi:hypothetical protein
MSVVFALVLLGCADDGTGCQPLAAPAQIFASKQQCEARQDGALASDIVLMADYPTVVSRCLRRSAASAR